MSSFEIGLYALPVMLVLILARIPIMLSMLAVGIIGQYFILGNWAPFLLR